MKPPTPDAPPDVRKAYNDRRLIALRRFRDDPQFQEFVQVGIFEDMVDNLSRKLRDRGTTGRELEVIRDQLVWAEQLRDHIANELRIADQQQQAEAVEIQAPQNPRGSDIDA